MRIKTKMLKKFIAVLCAATMVASGAVASVGAVNVAKSNASCPSFVNGVKNLNNKLDELSDTLVNLQKRVKGLQSYGLIQHYGKKLDALDSLNRSISDFIKSINGVKSINNASNLKYINLLSRSVNSVIQHINTLLCLGNNNIINLADHTQKTILDHKKTIRHYAENLTKNTKSILENRKIRNGKNLNNKNIINNINNIDIKNINDNKTRNNNNIKPSYRSRIVRKTSNTKNIINNINNIDINKININKKKDNNNNNTNNNYRSRIVRKTSNNKNIIKNLNNIDIKNINDNKTRNNNNIKPSYHNRIVRKKLNNKNIIKNFNHIDLNKININKKKDNNNIINNINNKELKKTNNNKMKDNNYNNNLQNQNWNLNDNDKMNAAIEIANIRDVISLFNNDKNIASPDKFVKSLAWAKAHSNFDIAFSGEKGMTNAVAARRGLYPIITKRLFKEDVDRARRYVGEYNDLYKLFTTFEELSKAYRDNAKLNAEQFKIKIKQKAKEADYLLNTIARSLGM